MISVVLEARMTRETKGVCFQVSGWMIGQRELPPWVSKIKLHEVSGTFGLLLFWDFFLGEKRRDKNELVVNIDMLLEVIFS